MLLYHQVFAFNFDILIEKFWNFIILQWEFFFILFFLLRTIRIQVLNHINASSRYQEEI